MEPAQAVQVSWIVFTPWRQSVLELVLTGLGRKNEYTILIQGRMGKVGAPTLRLVSYREGRHKCLIEIKYCDKIHLMFGPVFFP